MDPNSPSPNQKAEPKPRLLLSFTQAHLPIDPGSAGPVTKIYEGQLALQDDMYCKATGKRQDDGTPGYMQSGIIRRLELFGGPLDGLVIDYIDPGNPNHWDELAG